MQIFPSDELLILVIGSDKNLTWNVFRVVPIIKISTHLLNYEKMEFSTQAPHDMNYGTRNY